MKPRFIFAAACVIAAGCQSESPLELPAVHRPLGTTPFAVTLRGCPVPLPRVRSDNPGCPAEAIGTTIDEQRLCQMLVRLRDWIRTVPLEPELVQPGDWERVRAVSVCRMPLTMPDGKRRFHMILAADAPERPREFFVEWWEDRPEAFRFGANHK